MFAATAADNQYFHRSFHLDRAAIILEASPLTVIDCDRATGPSTRIVRLECAYRAE